MDFQVGGIVHRRSFFRTVLAQFSMLPDLLRTNKPQRGVLGEALRVVHVFVSCQTAVHRLPQQVSQRQLGVLPPRVGQVLLGKFANPGRSSNSRTRIRPPSEVTRHPWKSTFKEASKES